MTQTMLAQMPVPTSMQIGGWIICLAAFLWLLNQAYKAKQNFLGGKEKNEISPQPLSVTMMDKYATDADCKARHDREGKRIYDLSQEIEKLRIERNREAALAASSRKAVYERIEQVRKELAGHSEAARRELGEKIDNIAPQLIATLKNTQGLFGK